MTQTAKVRSLPIFLFPILSSGLILGLLFWWKVSNPVAISPYRYRFISPEPGTITKELSQEISFLQQRIKLVPNDGMERANLAQTYLKMARATGNTQWYLLAQQSAQKSLANLSFSNSNALIVLARIAEAKHDFATAIKLANQVLKQLPQNEGALSILVVSNLAIANLAEASKAADRLVAKIPSLNSFSLRALVKVAQGKDSAAIQNFQQAIAVEDAGESGSSAKVRTLWGRFYAQRGKLSEARQLYEEALRILPRYPFALINLAELETSQGNYQAAENYYSSVFVSAAYPSTFDHIAWYGRSQLKVLQGDRSTAKAYWQKAKSLLDQHQDLNGFGHRREAAKLLLARANSADLVKALSLMEAELKIRRDLETLDLYAIVLIELKRWKEAEKAIDEALNLGTRSDVLHYRAAVVAQGLGDSAKAAIYLQKAKAINPTFEPKFSNQIPKTTELISD